MFVEPVVILEPRRGFGAAFNAAQIVVLEPHCVGGVKSWS